MTGVEDIPGPRGGTVRFYDLECLHRIWIRERKAPREQIRCTVCWVTLNTNLDDLDDTFIVRLAHLVVAGVHRRWAELQAVPPEHLLERLRAVAFEAVSPDARTSA